MDYLKLAEENFKNDNYNKTIEYCDKLIEKGLYLTDAYRLKAFSQYFISDEKNDKIIKEALKNINVAIEQDSENDDLFYIKAIILEDMEKYEDALIEINKAIFCYPKNSYYYHVRGRINKSLDRKTEAVNDLTLSLKIKDTSNAYNERGELYYDMDEPELARQDFQRAVELDDKNSFAWQNLGRVLCDDFDLYEAAISAFNAAIKLNPENDYLYYQRGWVKHKLKRDKEALEDINKAIEMDSKCSFYYKQRGFLFLKFSPEKDGNKELHEEFSFYKQKPSKKNIELAEKDFKKAIELDENYSPAYRALFTLYNNYKPDYKKEIEFINKVIELESDDKSLYYTKAGTEFLLHDYKNAITDYSKYLEFEPEDSAAYGYRGLCFSFLDKDEEALADMDKSLEISPCGEVYVNRGIVKHSLKDCDGALEDYKKALELDPELNEAYFNTCCIKEEQKKYEEAIENCLTAYKILLKEGEDFDVNEYVERFYISLKGLFGEKKYKKVVNICNKIIKAGIRHEKIFNTKGAAKIMLKKYDDALKACNFALKLNPDFKPAKINLKIIKKNMKNKG
ncbi:MAG: tetratricopeptide repeat protein [Candidatus Gastranaerophilales bacterium]|nr:tetratricopeptide repeat protein [Candidatus Gastranaerophilales bacterium]